MVNLFTDPKQQPLLEEQMTEDWNQGQEDSDQEGLKDSATLYKIHYQINKLEASQASKTRRLELFYRVAAILLVPVLIAFLLQYFNNDSVTLKTFTTPLAVQSTFELPDGTQVWLNAGSTLEFPDHFSKNERKVKLKGEAYFDVKKNGASFIVETQHCEVEVLGTAFNVMTYDGSIPAVTLDRGKVVVKSNGENSTALNPGQQALIDTLDQQVRVKQVETNQFSAWRQHQLIFKHESLSQVVPQLERWYNLSIEITDPSLGQYEMTANIEYESFQEVMELMCLSMPIEYEFDKSRRKITIKPIVKP